MMVQQDQSLVVTVKTAAAMLSLCETEVRNLIAENKLVGIKIGNRWRIKRSSIYRLIDEPMQGEQEAK